MAVIYKRCPRLCDILIKLLGICRRDHIRTEEIRKLLCAACVVNEILSYQIEWSVHVDWRKDHRLLKKMLDWKPTCCVTCWEDLDRNGKSSFELHQKGLIGPCGLNKGTQVL
jgi:hypothetical protein